MTEVKRYILIQAVTRIGAGWLISKHLTWLSQFDRVRNAPAIPQNRYVTERRETVLAVAIMARTKQSVSDKHRSAQQAAAAAGRGVCKRGPINIRAARILSSQEVALLPPVKRARSSQDEERSDSDDDEEVCTPPCSTAVLLMIPDAGTTPASPGTLHARTFFHAASRDMQHASYAATCSSLGPAAAAAYTGWREHTCHAP